MAVPVPKRRLFADKREGFKSPTGLPLRDKQDLLPCDVVAEYDVWKGFRETVRAEVANISNAIFDAANAAAEEASERAGKSLSEYLVGTALWYWSKRLGEYLPARIVSVEVVPAEELTEEVRVYAIVQVLRQRRRVLLNNVCIDNAEQLEWIKQ